MAKCRFTAQLNRAVLLNPAFDIVEAVVATESEEFSQLLGRGGQPRCDATRICDRA